MPGERKVNRYVAAQRDLTLLKRQLAAYPELAQNEAFMTNLAQTKTAALLALRPLTGGEIGRARRLLAEADAQADA